MNRPSAPIASTAILLATALSAQNSLTRQEREPTPRRFCGAAYDLARGCTVMFGGQTTEQDSGTYEWDGQRWNVASTSAPTSSHHAMAYDLARGRTLAFGLDLGGLWEWDGVSWAPRVGAGPSPSRTATMAYDIARQRTVLYDTLSAQTWEYDGTAWAQRQASSLQVGSARMAYDAASRRSLLVGFSSQDCEVWSWDGSTWTQLTRTPVVSGVPRRDHHQVAYDLFRQRLVLFGGDLGHLYDNATWEWDGTAWTRRSPAQSPVPRYGHALVYDVARRRTVLFGGQYRNAMADTWEWDGTNWTPSTPPPRQSPASAYDSARGRIVVFGGLSPNDEPLDDTWEWDGFRWRKLSPASKPPARESHAMAFDERRQRVVMFGGRAIGATTFNDTWEWDGSNWTRALPAASPPFSLNRGAMTWDRVRQRVLLVPSLTGSQTWEWDGLNWARLAPTNGPVGQEIRGAYDVSRRRAVFLVQPYGAGPAQTWEWDGTSWAALTNAALPGIGNLTYDASRQRVIAASGPDLWQWDGSAWSLLAPGFLARLAPADVLEFDGSRNRLLVMTYRGTAVSGATARAVGFGQGCSSRSGGTPLLGSYLPYLANESFAFHLGNAPAAQPCVLALAAGTRVTTLVGGCTLYLDQPLFLPATASVAGVARLRLTIPDLVSLRGAQLYAQGFVGDAGNVLGIGASAARALTIGD
jgi:hypothetical protein